MRNYIEKYKDGFVTVRLESSCPERFFRLCAINQLFLWNVKCKDKIYEFNLSIEDFFRVQPFRRKTNARIKIIEKHGMPFFFKRNKKRKAFFIGFIIFFMLLYACSLFIWEIKVEGNNYYSDETVIHALKENDITQGIRKSQLECTKIAEQLRAEFSELVWVSVRIEGTSLLIDVKENENLNSDTNESMDTWDLIAKKDGIIRAMVTREGMPLFQVGDSCKKGDVIVTGRVDILDNDSMVKGYAYTGADADILIETTHSYYDEFDLSFQKKVYDQKTYAYPMIQIANKVFSYMPENKKESEITHQIRQLRLSSSFYLPISVGKIVVRPYEYKTDTYSKEEALELADRNLRDYMQEMVENKKEILQKDVSTTVTSKKCITKGIIYVLEKAVEKKEISPQIMIDEKQNEN